MLKYSTAPWQSLDVIYGKGSAVGLFIYLFIYYPLSFTFHRFLGINPLDIGIVIYKQSTLNMYRNTLINIHLSYKETVY
jgi:hypothetical protein